MSGLKFFTIINILQRGNILFVAQLDALYDHVVGVSVSTQHGQYKRRIKTATLKIEQGNPKYSKNIINTILFIRYVDKHYYQRGVQGFSAISEQGASCQAISCQREHSCLLATL